jgi:hypothetical protein
MSLDIFLMARTALEDVMHGSYSLTTPRFRLPNLLTPRCPPLPEDFGNKLSDLNGRQRWDLAGRLLETWNGWLRSLIEIVQDNLKKFRGSYRFRDEEIVQHCWMIGKDTENARPRIVIGANAQVILDRAARFIRKNKRIKGSGFALMGVLNAKFTLLDSRDGVHILDPGSEFVEYGPSRLLIDRTYAQATIGGAIIFAERPYGLTAAHPFLGSNDETTPLSSAPEFFDYDLDSVSSDSESDYGCDEDPSTDSEGTLEDMPKDSSVRQRHSEYTGGYTSVAEMFPWLAFMPFLDLRDSTACVSLPYSSIILADQDGGDWALVPLDDSRSAVNQGHKSLHGKTKAFIQDIATEAASGDVFVSLLNEIFHGRVSSSACSVKEPSRTATYGRYPSTKKFVSVCALFAWLSAMLMLF